MSLLEKLGQKKAQKEQQKQEAVVQEKRQSFAEINKQALDLNEKKQRIISLKKSLEQHYANAQGKLENFKSQKATLKGAYEGNKDILEEDGVESFEDMLEENADEPEVKNYRRAGGRAPSEQKGAKLSANEDGIIEAGKTGELYKAVGTLKEIKDSLQAEMPEGIKLNFSAVTKKEESLSNREQSFLQIDEYLKTLDKEIVELNKQKEEAYLKTPEGVKEALNNIQSPEYVFRDQRPDNLNYFEVSDRVLKLSEKTGLEPIKTAYSEALAKNLEKLAWDKKDVKEKAAINNYPALEALSNFNYNLPEIKEVEKQYRETVAHIASILEKDASKSEEIGEYGISKKEGLYSQDSWSGQEEALADAFIKSAGERAGVTDPEKIKQEIKLRQEDLNYINGSNNSGYRSLSGISSPEHFRIKLEKYSRFLEYLKNNADSQSNFIGSQDKNNGLIYQVRKQNGFAHEEDKARESLTYINVPLEYIKNNGGFYRALDDSRQKYNAWESDKSKIGEISKAAVDFRFTQAWERYFSNNNAELLNRLDTEKRLSDGLQRALSYLEKHPNLNDPEMSGRKLKIEAGFHGSKIHEANSEYQPIREASDAVRNKINQYAQEKNDELEREISKLRLATIVMGRSGKIEKLETKIRVFKSFKNDTPLNEKELINLGISQEEIDKMKELRAEKDKTDKDYRNYDNNRIRFFRSLDEHRLEIPIKNDDILNNQEMSFAEFPGRLQARQNEIKTYFDNLPEKEKTVLDERERAIKEIDEKSTAFNQTVAKNIDIIKKLR